jgi:hypothetical protein
MSLHRRTQARRAAVVQIGRGGPGIAQSRYIDTRKRSIEALAGSTVNRADILQAAGIATDGKVVAAVAADAIVGKDSPPRHRGRGERAVRVAERAGGESLERSHVSSQRIEIGADSRLRIAQRLIASAGVVGGVGHQTGTARKIADLLLEILEFIEVGAPMQEAVSHGGAAVQGDGVAQPFAEAGYIPDPTVTAAVIVATGATDIGIAREPRIPGVVE